MQTAQLRKRVSAVALAVAITTGVAVPTGYFLLGYSNSAQTLSFKARLNAARVAQYIYVHQELWQYQQLRLSELIRLPETGEQPIRQTVYDLNDERVLEEGPSLVAPVIIRRVPIMVGDAVAGSLVAETSLRELVRETGLVALASALLGFAIYFALRLFPLRALDRTLEQLRGAERNLAAQNERLDAALNNMAQGLCMADADHRLTVFNHQVAEIFGIPPERMVAGMPMTEFMALARMSDRDPETARLRQRQLLAEGLAGTAVTTLADGRIISISHRPMRDGGSVGTFTDITEQRAAEERIAYLAHHDALTDLANRVLFYERMEDYLDRLDEDQSLAVLSLDLDNFKSVNDTLGHPIGDDLLRLAAERMRGCVREDDIVARLGGDEFAVVQVPTSRAADAGTLAARLIEVVGAPYEIDGRQVVVGASVGIAIAPADGSEPDALLKNADLALYRAKADGGGVYRFFEPDMDARMQARRVLELDLRKAIVNGEFELYYQPIIDVKSGRITACEALVRWHHPERGMVAPLEFVPVAEETGLIVPLGEWVLREACREAARWPHAVTVAVNLSPAQFRSSNLLPAVTDALRSSGLRPDRLELEITELVLLQESDDAFAVLHKLRDLGIRIAMDDFGTGYSSLGYLRSFPFDKIKIDQSFIHDLPAKGDSVAIVRAVVGLSSSLGITTTAECVETAQQLEQLAAEGCNEVQGFLFSPPRPAAEVGQLLAESTSKAEAVA